MYTSGNSGFASPRLLQRSQFYSNYQPVLAPENTPGPGDRPLFFMSPMPLNNLRWAQRGDYECVALSTYKEGFANKIQIVHGSAYLCDDGTGVGGDGDATRGDTNSAVFGTPRPHGARCDGFDFTLAADVSVDYPVTQLQWDPRIAHEATARLAASLEVVRLFAITDSDGEPRLEHTHTLANTAAGSAAPPAAAPGTDPVTTLPPVTSFDWNTSDPTTMITSSVDTTCTLWDLSRTDGKNGSDAAAIKTQLIAHDSEVFDVKFIHNSTNIFASVGNDGLMRVFDLRLLEHSTIVYEPGPAPLLSGMSAISGMASYSPAGSRNPALPMAAPRALLRLAASNVDQHHLATVGAGSNSVIIIDMRMPGMPLTTLDGSLGGTNYGAINSLQWHPAANYLLTGGDDCQALVWDCTGLPNPKAGVESAVADPVLVHEEDLEVNSVCWRSLGDWFGVVSGKGFQAVLVG